MNVHPVDLGHEVRQRVQLRLALAREFVLLGSVVETKWLDAGQHARIEIDELGALEVTVER